MKHPDEAVLRQVVGTVDVTEMRTQPPHVALHGADEVLHGPRVTPVARGQREAGQLVGDEAVGRGHGRDRSRLTLLGLLLAGLLTTIAGPATAATFTGYETKVTSITPTVAGVTATAALDGESITLTNTGDQPVIVEGYQGEPYVKVTAEGVWQNSLSPAVYLNKEQSIGNIPQDANADKKPQWVKISDNHRFSWHDHRIHWMGSSEPPAVAADPGSPHLISDWTIPMLVGGDTDGTGGQSGTIAGTLSYVPGSDWGRWLPYLAIAAGVAVVVGVQLLVVRRRRAR